MQGSRINQGTQQEITESLKKGIREHLTRKFTNVLDNEDILGIDNQNLISSN